MTILAPFGGPWPPFWDHFTIKWVTYALRGTLEGPRVDFHWILMDLGFPLETILDHSLIFSVIWSVKTLFGLQAWLLLTFELKLCWFLMSQPLNLYCKYWCFHWISLFWLFHEFDDFRSMFGPRSGHFWRSWDINLMIFTGIGDCLKFHWFSGSHQRHPKLREPGCWRVNW